MSRIRRVESKIGEIVRRRQAKKRLPIVIAVKSKRGPTIAKCDVDGNVWVYSHYVEEFVRSKSSWLYEGQEDYVRQRVRHEWQPVGGGHKVGLKGREKHLTILEKPVKAE